MSGLFRILPLPLSGPEDGVCVHGIRLSPGVGVGGGNPLILESRGRGPSGLMDAGAFSRLSLGQLSEGLLCWEKRHSNQGHAPFKACHICHPSSE